MHDVRSNPIVAAFQRPKQAWYDFLEQGTRKLLDLRRISLGKCFCVDYVSHCPGEELLSRVTLSVLLTNISLCGIKIKAVLAICFAFYAFQVRFRQLSTELHRSWYSFSHLNEFADKEMCFWIRFEVASSERLWNE